MLPKYILVFVRIIHVYTTSKLNLFVIKDISDLKSYNKFYLGVQENCPVDASSHLQSKSQPSLHD